MNATRQLLRKAKATARNVGDVVAGWISNDEQGDSVRQKLNDWHDEVNGKLAGIWTYIPNQALTRVDATRYRAELAYRPGSTVVFYSMGRLRLGFDYHEDPDGHSIVFCEAVPDPSRLQFDSLVKL